VRYFIVLVKRRALIRLPYGVTLLFLGDIVTLGATVDLVAGKGLCLAGVDLELMGLWVVRDGLSNKVAGHRAIPEAEDRCVLALLVHIFLKVHVLSKKRSLSHIDLIRAPLLFFFLPLGLSVRPKLQALRMHLAPSVTFPRGLISLKLPLYLLLHFLPLLVLVYFKGGLVLLFESRHAPIVLASILLSGKILNVFRLGTIKASTIFPLYFAVPEGILLLDSLFLLLLLAR
jgi:hypothetical protein